MPEPPSTAAAVVKIIVTGLVQHGQSPSGEPTFIVARRPAHAHLGGMWELPGGKLELGEAPEVGLRREIREELNIDLETVAPLTFSHHVYPPDKSLLLLFYAAKAVPGAQPEPCAATELRYLTKNELIALEMPVANAPLKAALRGPE